MYESNIISKISDFINYTFRKIYILHVKIYFDNKRVTYMRLLFIYEELENIFLDKTIKLKDNDLFDYKSSKYYKEFPNLGKCYDLYKIYTEHYPNVLAKPEEKPEIKTEIKSEKTIDEKIDECLNSYNYDIKSIINELQQENIKLHKENAELKEKNKENEKMLINYKKNNGYI